MVSIFKITQRLTKSPLNQFVHVTQKVVDEVKELSIPEIPTMVENVLGRINAIEEQLTKDEKSEETNENIQKHLDAIKKRIPTFKAALTNAIKKTYEMEERHENSLYQRLLHLINSEEERILIKDQLEEIDEVITSINDLQNDLDFDKILDDYPLIILILLIQNFLVDNINTPHPKLPSKINKDCINFNLKFSTDETSQVVGTPNTGRLTDFLWTNSGRSTGWQGPQSGRKERIVPGFFSNWFSSWRDYTELSICHSR
ncbi:35577_t:CDS:2, partial [Gigaspora margarita]